MQIGMSVKQLRQNLGLTQAAFASQIGITPSFLSSVERGSKNLSSRILLNIQNTFNIAIDSILLGDTKNSFYSDNISLEMKTLGIKIKELRKSLGLTQIEFAKRIGIAQGFLSHIERGEVNFTSDILFKIKQEFDVDISSWANSGDSLAQPLKHEKDKLQSSVIRSPFVEIRGLFDAVPDVTMMPEVILTVRAGQPTAYIGEDILGYVNMKGTFIARIIGTSMQGAGLNDGDEIIIERRSTYRSGDIIVARIGDEYTIKRVQNGNGYVLLNPANPEYETIKITPDLDFFCEGVWTGFKRTSTR